MASDATPLCCEINCNEAATRKHSQLYCKSLQCVLRHVFPASQANLLASFTGCEMTGRFHAGRNDVIRRGSRSTEAIFVLRLQEVSFPKICLKPMVGFPERRYSAHEYFLIEFRFVCC